MCIYMPMIPELVVAVLGCARIGAIHSVVFAGFSAQSIADRIQDANVVQRWYDARRRRAVKSVVDEALATCPGVKRVIVTKRIVDPVAMKDERDVGAAR